jgi:hypothetical protein
MTTNSSSRKLSPGFSRVTLSGHFSERSLRERMAIPNDDDQARDGINIEGLDRFRQFSLSGRLPALASHEPWFIRLPRSLQSTLLIIDPEDIFRTLHRLPSRGTILASYELPQRPLLQKPSGT